MDDIPTCARHPDVETRLRCSACGTPICPDCGREAAVGFKCPDCAAHLEGTTTRRSGSGLLSRFSGGSDRGERDEVSSHKASVPRDGDGLPVQVGARAALTGLAAAVAGGLVLSPVFHGGMFLLISAGVIGWAVARAVYWATEERSTPFVRAAALALAGFAVAIGMAFAGVGTAPPGLLFLAYPAAVYGGWIVVRQR